MTEVLPPDLQQFVHHQLESGVYRTEEELVVDAVRLLRDSDSHWHSLRDSIQAQAEELARGEGFTLEGDEALAEFLAEIRKEVRSEIASRKSEQA